MTSPSEDAPGKTKAGRKKSSSGLGRDKRLWLAGGATLAVVLVLIGWFEIIQPELSAASATRETTETAQLQNAVLEAKNAELKAQNDAPALRAGLVSALAELPSDGGLPDFTRQLSAQATATSVVLSSVVVGAATPVAGTGGDASGKDIAGNDGTIDSGGSDDGSTSDAEPDALVQLTISVTATGLGPDLQAFLREVQVTGPRRALVTESQLTPLDGTKGVAGGPSTLNLTLDIFAAPLSPDDQAALEKLLSNG